MLTKLLATFKMDAARIIRIRQVQENRNGPMLLAIGTIEGKAQVYGAPQDVMHIIGAVAAEGEDCLISVVQHDVEAPNTKYPATLEE